MKLHISHLLMVDSSVRSWHVGQINILKVSQKVWHWTSIWERRKCLNSQNMTHFICTWGSICLSLKYIMSVIMTWSPLSSSANHYSPKHVTVTRIWRPEISRKFTLVRALSVLMERDWDDGSVQLRVSNAQHQSGERRR